MSAFIVKQHHITYLVAAALSNRINKGGGAVTWYHNNIHHELTHGDTDRAAEVANMLWRETVVFVDAIPKDFTHVQYQHRSVCKACAQPFPPGPRRVAGR